MYIRFFKRPFDLILGILAAVLLLPLMVGIGIAVKIDDPKGCVIFKQTRIGKDGRKFKILKFRSMKTDTPRHLPNSAMTTEAYGKYVTKFGKFLRQYSLDELPQVFNIIKGDMSVVGPRPVVANEHELLREREKAGLTALRPGLTGWAQINGRNNLSDEDKLRFDIEYADKISFSFDFLCLFKTLPIVVTKKGFSEGRDRIDRHADFEPADEVCTEDEVSIALYSEEDSELKEKQHT